MHVKCKQHMQASPFNEAEPHLIIFQTFMPIILMNKFMLFTKGGEITLQFKNLNRINYPFMKTKETVHKYENANFMFDSRYSVVLLL